VAAVGELQPEYENQIFFNIIPAEETLKRTDEVNGFGFQDQKHGLVAFDADGEPVVLIPGHQFGKAEIQAAVEKVLGTP